MDGAPSRSIGRYEIQSEIGRGSMGVVYRAYDPLLRRPIALKTILVRDGEFETEAVHQFEERFFQEARAAARLSHPAIVLVHDIGRDAKTATLYMALEFLSGQTVAQMTEGGRALDWRAAVTIAETVAEGLYHAAVMGVIHRDVKPANIMVLPSGQPKIMDFGIAKVETVRLRLTKVGEAFGTPLYMSPEQTRGEEADPRSDLFSLGSTLYKMLTGRDAFAALSLAEVLRRVSYDEPVWPSRLQDTVPATLDLVLAGALAKKREDRYPDAKAMADDLRDVLQGHPPRHVSDGASAGLYVRPGVEAEGLPELVAELSPDPAADISTLVRRPEPPTLPGVEPAPSGSGAGTTGSGPSKGRLLAAASAAVFGLVLVALVETRRETTPGTRSKSTATATATATTAPPATQASPPPARAAAPPRASTPPRSRPSTTLASTKAPDPPAAAVDAPAPATLRIDLEHDLKSGRLRVWVDGDPVLDERLDSQVTKKALVLKSRKGGFEKALPVSPGRHEIKVQVAWGDTVKTEVIGGTFKSGATRTLAARVRGLIRKNLSVEWE